jgi:hypothetical protein
VDPIGFEFRPSSSAVALPSTRKMKVYVFGFEPHTRGHTLNYPD